MEKRESYTADGNVNWWSLYGKQHGGSSKKQKIELPYDPAILLQDIYLKKTVIQKDTRTPVFAAALFTIARARKQTRCPSTDRMVKEEAVHIYNRLLLSHEKEWNNVICSNMDEPRDYHPKWSKPDKDKCHMNTTYVWSLQINVSTNRSRLSDIQNRLVVAKRGWGKDRLGVWD